MNVSPFDHPVLSALFGHEHVADLFSLEAEVDGMAQFEVALAKATATHGFIPDGAADVIAKVLPAFTPDLEQLAAATQRDGVIVPNLVAQMRTHVGGDAAEFLHFGATSQDVIDSALILRLKKALEYLEVTLARTVDGLEALEGKFGEHHLMGVTRMQDALPITVADRVQSWRLPLQRHIVRLEELRGRLIALQFGGAVGTLHKFGDKGALVTAGLAKELHLLAPEKCWHSQRDNIVEFAGWLSLVSGSLGKMGQDFALMVQNPLGMVSFSGGGGSSAMPHKQNPVGAEILVALARFNGTQVSAMHQALLHENERSGAAWSLEWLVLPQMVVATAGGLSQANRLIASIKTFGRPA